MLYHLHCFLLVIFLSNVILGQKEPIALIGRILLTDHSIKNATLLLIDEHIAAVGDRITISRESIVIHTKGIILPGLIDLHNHLMYNIFPRWKPNQEHISNPNTSSAKSITSSRSRMSNATLCRNQSHYTRCNECHWRFTKTVQSRISTEP